MLDACGAIIQEFKCSVILVHHTGVNAEAQHRARGSSAWRGALDIEISVVPGETIEIVQRKSKDAEEAEPIWGQLQSVPITGWMDEDDEQVTSAVLVAGDEPVKAVKDGKLTKFQKDFESCWWHSGANIVDGSPFISRDDVVKFYVEARGIGLKSARQYAKSSNSSAMVGYLVSVEVIAVSGNGWVMMDNVSKSLMLLRKNEPGNEGNRS
jgi:hypothetical protein